MAKMLDYIGINDKFQSSVSVEFDLDSPDKLGDYLPTSDVCEILGSYLDDVRLNRNQSTQLVGPYGKGKSFLVLALLQILLGSASAKALRKFEERVGKVDPSLIEKINNARHYLPVVISGSYGSVRQAFMNALRASLQFAKQDDLIPDTAYSEAARLLNAWKRDPVISSTKLTMCGLDGAKADRLSKDLNAFSETAFSKFRELYKCVTSGSEFNPILSSDPIATYKSVAVFLKKKGFDGLFVVFDEFSKFLDGNPNNQGEELRFIQDFAELANRSNKNYSIHFCCITHKKLSLYANNDRASELLQAVEGRFVVRQFNRAMKESAELIDFSIEKKPKFSAFIDTYLSANGNCMDDLDEMGVFNRENDGIDARTMARLVYPLNPISAYALLQISEEVAQNERTLFTFIYGDDGLGLKSIISFRDANETIGADAVWDYFERQISESSIPGFKNIAFSCEGACSKYSDPTVTRILKSLACCLVLSSYRRIKSTPLALSLASGLDLPTVRGAIDCLEKDGIIRENKFDGVLDFTFVGSKEINLRADRLIKKSMKRFDITEALNEIYFNDYVLSRVYNSNKRMTRFARVIYVKEQTFYGISSFRQLSSRPSDGLLIRIIGNAGGTEKIIGHLKEVNDPLIVVQTSSGINEEALTTAASYYRAYEKMEGDPDLSKNDLASLSVMKDRLFHEIREAVDRAFKKPYVETYHGGGLAGKDVDETFSRAFEKAFNRTPIVNNEMLNRDHPTKIYERARDHLIDTLLSTGDDRKLILDAFGESRPEATIYRIFFDRANEEGDPYLISSVTDDIVERLNRSKSGLIPIRPIVESLCTIPYGIRIGSMPLFFTRAILKLNQFSDKTVTLFHGKKEEGITSSSLLSAITAMPEEEYTFKIDAGSKERGKFISDVISTFGGKAGNGRHANTVAAMAAMKNWYRNLPEVIRTATGEQYPTAINPSDEAILKELSKFDISPSNFFFEFLPKTLHENSGSLSKLEAILQEKKGRIENLCHAILLDVAQEIRSIPDLKGKTGSLASMLKGREKECGYQANDSLGNPTYDAIARTIFASSSFNDDSFIEELSAQAVGIYFEDWNDNIHHRFVKTLSDFVAYLTSPWMKDSKKTISQLDEMMESIDASSVSPVAKLVENQILDLLSQYNESLNTNDLIYVFGNILKGEAK